MTKISEQLDRSCLNLGGDEAKYKDQVEKLGLAYMNHVWGVSPEIPWLIPDEVNFRSAVMRDYHKGVLPAAAYKLGYAEGFARPDNLGIMVLIGIILRYPRPCENYGHKYSLIHNNGNFIRADAIRNWWIHGIYTGKGFYTLSEFRANPVNHLYSWGIKDVPSTRFFFTPREVLELKEGIKE